MLVLGSLYLGFYMLLAVLAVVGVILIAIWVGIFSLLVQIINSESNTALFVQFIIPTIIVGSIVVGIIMGFR